MSERTRDNLAQLALVMIVLSLVAWPIFTGQLGQKASDHRFFHLPLVREWSSTWPVVNLRDYNSATGPLYHWIMAGIAQLTGTRGGPETSPPLQFASALFAALAVLVTYRFARRCVAIASAFMAALALAVSPYFLGNAIWMMTDNLSLALVALTVGSAVFMPWTPSRTLGQGVAASLAVATRQINLWLVAPIAIATILRSPRDRRSIVMTAIACTAVVATLATFVLLWGGIVPPKFRGLHASGIQPSAIGFTLTLVAAYGICLAPAMRDGWRSLGAQPKLLIAVIALGAIVASVGRSFASVEAGRNGGWVWRAVEHLPIIAERSPLIVGGGALGAVVLSALFIQAKRVGRASAAIVLLSALAGFVAAHVANAQVFQRYYDPMVLLTLVWLVAIAAPQGASSSRSVFAALALLVMQQACFAVFVLYAPMSN